MIGKILTRNDPFEGGPPHRVERAVGLIKPDDLRIANRVFLVVLIGWIIPALLSAIDGRVFNGERSGAFIFDFAIAARFLIAAPLLIIAEAITIPRLADIAHHFLASGLVAEHDRARFDEAISSIRKLSNSWLVEFIVIGLAFTVVAAEFRKMNLQVIPAWYKSGGDGQLGLSAAGWWSIFVSVPLLIILFLGWMWRVFLWGRFLWMMSRLNLQLNPGHPDLAGGLKFTSYSLRAFYPIGFALGAVVAGVSANRIVYQGVSTGIFKKAIIALVIFVVVLFSGPLLVFTRNLIVEKRRGVLAYGALALGLGRQFEHKWIEHAWKVEESALEAADFSSTADLYGVVSNVYRMWAIPIDIRDVSMLIIVTVLPFLPIILLVIPTAVIWENLTKLLF